MFILPAPHIFYYLSCTKCIKANQTCYSCIYCFITFNLTFTIMSRVNRCHRYFFIFAITMTSYINILFAHFNLPLSHGLQLSTNSQDLQVYASYLALNICSSFPKLYDNFLFVKSRITFNTSFNTPL